MSTVHLPGMRISERKHEAERAMQSCNIAYCEVVRSDNIGINQRGSSCYLTLSLHVLLTNTSLAAGIEHEPDVDSRNASSWKCTR